MASFQDRVIGALKLQASTFEEVEADRNAMGQAAAVVLAASVASGIGWIWYGGISGIIRGAIASLIGWVISAALIWAIGTKMMPGKNTQADIQQMMRVLGFAQAPGIFAVIAIVPILGWLAAFLVWIWTLVATVIAVRQGLDYDDTMKAVIVCVIAMVIGFLVSLAIAAVFGLSTVARYR